MRLLKEDKLGARSIDMIKPSDAKEDVYKRQSMIRPIIFIISTNIIEERNIASIGV